MKNYRVHFEVKTAPGSFYPHTIIVRAKDAQEAAKNAQQIINNCLDKETVESWTMGNVELI